jgi:hypothetical protein
MAYHNKDICQTKSNTQYDEARECERHFLKYFYLSLIVHRIGTEWNSEQSLSSVRLGFSTRLQIEK